MKRCAAAILVLTIVSGAALAQSDERAAPGASGAAQSGGMFKGTPEEQAACRSDSTRFCLDDMPDSFRVLACLQKNRGKLRKACLKVLEAHGQ